ncbi:YqjF family protein [Arthrobacter nitrophenolicus]|uniref:Uncharacterized protein YqjF (DUF2071 family) n=2 Tax=Arthrobacter nitrophenolicus TaxID=683150 RepID=A0ACC6TGF1_9MICC|nr:DUF2071 domain-containing protein [Arthrobacter nitrophenolicus]ELT45436.1 hypothetical protein G205_05291 [Arthrobacter nitrophenolicus]
MDQDVDAGPLWPNPPELPLPTIMDQRWSNAIFLHWRIPEAEAALFMPAGVRPDVFDGSSWVGLIGFRMRKAGIGRGPAIPYLGTFNEVNVRLYSREADGTRGVVFLSLDADRLPVVLAARAAEIPYVWSRIHHHWSAPGTTGNGAHGYTVRRFRQGGRSRFSVAPHFNVPVDDPLSVHLTARFGMHGSFRGRTIYIPNSHEPWPLYAAELHDLDDGLVEAAGIRVSGPPESVLYSSGVRSRFGRPRVVTGKRQ